MHESRNFCQRRSNSDNVFFFFYVDERGENPTITKSGPILARLRSAIRFRALSSEPVDEF